MICQPTGVHYQPRLRLSEDDMRKGEWLPIKNAPRDGSEIDVWVRNFEVEEAGKIVISDVGRYCNVTWGIERQVYHSPYEVREGDHEGWLHDDCYSRIYLETGGWRVTHWMPKPEVPPSE